MRLKDVNKQLQTNEKSCPTKRNECLKQGYIEMSRINCQLAEEGLSADNDSLSLAEQNLRSVNDCDS